MANDILSRHPASPLWLAVTRGGSYTPAVRPGIAASRPMWMASLSGFEQGGSLSINTLSPTMQRPASRYCCLKVYGMRDRYTLTMFVDTAEMELRLLVHPRSRRRNASRFACYASVLAAINWGVKNLWFSTGVQIESARSGSGAPVGCEA